MKKKLIFLFSLVFLLSVSGVHGLVHEGNCGSHHQQANSQPAQENNSDCPCIFHSSGVINSAPVWCVNFSLLTDLQEEIKQFVSKIELKPNFSFSFLLRAPPLA